MQGALFYTAFADIAAGQRVRQQGAIKEIEEAFAVSGLSKTAYEESWHCLEKYKELFEVSVRQSALIALRSHWDWYISKLGAFILRQHPESGISPLPNKLQKLLAKVGFKEITEQTRIIASALSCELKIDPSHLESIHEMSLVRNLGLHNRWEVDEYYLAKSHVSGFKLREVRLFPISELEQWHQALISLISSTWKPVAIQYCGTSEHTI